MEFTCYYLNKSNKMQRLIRILYNCSRFIFIPRTKELAFQKRGLYWKTGYGSRYKLDLQPTATSDTRNFEICLPRSVIIF